MLFHRKASNLRRTDDRQDLTNACSRLINSVFAILRTGMSISVRVLRCFAIHSRRKPGSEIPGKIGRQLRLLRVTRSRQVYSAPLDQARQWVSGR